MATSMLENGADIRFIQEILGHAKLETTQIYTHVAIQQLKEIHTATHPAARLKRFVIPAMSVCTWTRIMPPIPEQSEEQEQRPYYRKSYRGFTTATTL